MRFKVWWLILWVECLFRKAQHHCLQFVPYVSGRSSPWVWAGGMESYIYPLAENVGRLKEKHSSWTRSSVRLPELACNFNLNWWDLAIARYLLLTVIPFDAFTLIPPRWRKWQPETLRICYWYGHFPLSRPSLMVTLVRHPHFWQTSTRTTQYFCNDTSISTLSLARTGQALHAHRWHAWPDGVGDCNAG